MKLMNINRTRQLRRAIDYYMEHVDDTHAVFNTRTGKIVALASAQDIGNLYMPGDRFDAWLFITEDFYPLYTRYGTYVGYVYNGTHVRSADQ